jgi:type I restriction enzyme, S subunit
LKNIDEMALPDGWKWVKVFDIGKIETGATPSKSDSNFYADEFPFYKPTDLEAGYNVRIARDNLSSSGLKEARFLPIDSILVTCIGATIGKTGIIRRAGACNQQINAIIPSKDYNPNFIYYQTIAPKFQKAIKDNAAATTLPILNKSKFQNLDMVYCSLPEQHAIVSKIEELLSELDKGKQQLETAQRQLKIYRQAVLKWAFEGKLSASEFLGLQNKQNDNATEGSSAKSSHSVNSDADNELPEGWKWVKSGELFSYVTSGSRGWAKYYSDEGAIFIRITNMNFDSLELDLTESNIQHVDLPLNSEGTRTKVQEGDFLFSITGYLGMFAIAPKLENAYVNQHVCLCRPKEGFNKKYVGYWIISKSGGHHYLNQNQKGAVKAGLNLDDLKAFPVPLAPLKEQQLIVQEIESRLSVCDKVEETITTSLAQAETLRQSILKKAFEGKLVNN